MKPPRKKQKRNISGLHNQPKVHTTTTDAGNEAPNLPLRHLDSITTLSEHILEENPDEDWKPQIHFDSAKPSWHLGAEESDGDENEDLEDWADFDDEGVYSRMVEMAITLGDDPRDVDWVPKIAKTTKKTDAQHEIVEILSDSKKDSDMEIKMEPEDTAETFDISQYPLPDISIHEKTPESAILTFEASAEADLTVPI
ncbi:hypothetical protein C0993_008243 [Termitomyces sp. T159_Od127]|nr:hypothetical protein C0993_008243 [Termitomyces sp. T159_Od127]